jgi:hypothetical protein
MGRLQMPAVGCQHHKRPSARPELGVGLEELVRGYEPGCRRGGLAVQSRLQPLAVARQPPVVSQLRKAETLVAKAREAEAAAQDQGVHTRAAVWGHVQRRHNTSPLRHTGDDEWAGQQQYDFDQRGGQGHCDVDGQVEEGGY